MAESTLGLSGAGQTGRLTRSADLIGSERTGLDGEVETTTAALAVELREAARAAEGTADTLAVVVAEVESRGANEAGGWRGGADGAVAEAGRAQAIVADLESVIAYGAGGGRVANGAVGSARSTN